MNICSVSKIITNLHQIPIYRQIMKDLNRLKIVLVEQKRTGKWLAEQLGKDTSTLSKWCSNKIQPSLEVLTQIANVLEIDVRQLINSNITTSN